jgi:ribose transport system permease protein
VSTERRFLNSVKPGVSLFKSAVWRLSLAVMLVLMVLITIVQPNYILPYNLLIKLRTWIPLILVAYGQTFVILGGGIDLSVGTMIALVNVTTVEVLGMTGYSPMGITIALTAGLLTGLAAGALNGFCVAHLRFQPIITTFATGIIWKGIALWIRPESGGDIPMSVFDLYSGRILFMPLALWILLFLFLYYIFFRGSRFSVHLRAVGSFQAGAFETGLPVSKIRWSSYALCGLFVAFASMAILGETITGNPYAGQGYELESISAVALGGTSLAGGLGGHIGSIIGACIIKLVNDAIFFLGIPVNFQKLMQGLILVVALAVGGVFSKRSRREN